MNVLIACEFSGIVRNAFEELGHNAWSADLQDTELPGNHYKGDCFDVIKNPYLCNVEKWDILIGHPPCTFLCVSGARWWGNAHSEKDQEDAIDFFRRFMLTDIERVCIENPVGIISRFCNPTQYIQPWEHGHGVTKKTGLWLKGLPCLTPSNVVSGRIGEVHYMSGKNRQNNRSRTYPGIAKAMALQWGNNVYPGFQKWDSSNWIDPEL